MKVLDLNVVIHARTHAELSVYYLLSCALTYANAQFSYSQKLDHIYYYEMAKTKTKRSNEIYKLYVLSINHFARSLTKELTHPQFIFDNDDKKNLINFKSTTSESKSKGNGFRLVLLICTYFAFAK